MIQIKVIIYVQSLKLNYFVLNISQKTSHGDTEELETAFYFNFDFNKLYTNYQYRIQVKILYPNPPCPPV